ncbi:MAG: hypothetical protein FJ271_32855 [Planctomycetes bacterium]|nr:hypothetical protein [Planctomycetota bacterium]
MKRSVLIAGAAAVVVSLGAAGAWLTRPPDAPPPPRLSKAAKARAAAVSAVAVPATPSVAEIALAEPSPPPEPTRADFDRIAPTQPPPTIDWTTLPIDELRTKANANDVPAMEELARRLVQGIGVARDQQAGAGWLLRAAQRGSAQSAFNVGVMYERGFVVERDSSKAIEWYRKALEADLPAAKHNLALLLRDGKGAPRNVKEAVELLRSAARQGMAASMFTLGDIYERGDAGHKDPATALAWFAIAAEFERQTNRSGDSALAKMAGQRVQALQRVLLPGELERAQQFGQAEFKQIVEALQPPKPAPSTPVQAAVTPTPAPAVDPESDPPGWPKATAEQIRAVQQALVELKFLRDRPDGVLGPLTRSAIRAFQRSVAMRETGEPARDVFTALQQAIASREAAPKSETAKTETKAEPPKLDTVKADAVKAEAAKADAARLEAEKLEAARAEAAKAEAVKAEAAKTEIAKAQAAKSVAATTDASRQAAAASPLPKVDPPKPPMPAIDAARPAALAVPNPEPPGATPAKSNLSAPPLPVITLVASEPPPPPTSADIARLMPKPANSDPMLWPAATLDQIKAIQALLRDLKFSRDAPDGVLGPATRTAIRDFERSLGLAPTGEPSKDLYESLKEIRALTTSKAN